MSASSDYLRVLTDITREGGATRAATQRANAQIWGNAIAKLGDYASDTVKQYGVEKKAKKLEQEDQNLRDLFGRAQQEWQAQQQPSVQDLTGGMPGIVSEGPQHYSLEQRIAGVPQQQMGMGLPQQGGASASQPDTMPLPQGPELSQARSPRAQPFPSPSEIIKAVGPVRGIPIINAMAALQKTTDPIKEDDQRQEYTRKLMLGLHALPADMRAQAYPAVRQQAIRIGALRPEQAPEAYDEAWWQRTIGYGQEPPKPSSAQPTEASLAADLSSPDPVVRERARVALDRLKPLTNAKGLNTLTELQIDAATPDSPTRAHSQAVLDNLPESSKVSGPEMDERYRKIMMKPVKARTADETAWAGAYERQKAVSQPAVVIQTEQGPGVLDRRSATVQPITRQGSGETVQAPVTQPQAQDVGFAKRLGDAKTALDKVSASITKMSLPDFMLQSRLPPAMQSETFQQYDVASRNLINAVLRRESGAAISQSEFDNARRQYLAQPGDTEAAKKLKAQNLDRQIQALQQGAGPAYKPDVPTDRVRVKGPNGERGTMPKGSALPPGWSKE